MLAFDLHWLFVIRAGQLLGTGAGLLHPSRDIERECFPDSVLWKTRSGARINSEGYCSTYHISVIKLI